MSQSRNKFIDRFRTQIFKPISNPSQQKTERQLLQNSSTHIRSNNTSKSNGRNIDHNQIIVKKMEQHIAYLQKKLKDAEQEIETLKYLLNGAEKKMVEHQIEQQSLIDQIEELNQNLRRANNDCEIVKSDYQNYVLKQKMEKLTGQVNEKREAYAKIQLKHHQHKKGRFSSAFLPSSFGSPCKYKQKDSKQYETIIEEYSLKNIHEKAAITKIAIDNKLIDQIKKVKEDNEILFKELFELRIKNKHLQEELQKSKQTVLTQQNSEKGQIQKLISQKNELQKKFDQVLRENKLFLNKITSNQEKMIEISIALNEKSQQEINNMISSTESLKPHENNKLEKQMQTQRFFNPQKSSTTKQLEQKIEALTSKLQEKEVEIEKYKREYKEQVGDLFNIMKKYNDDFSEIDDHQEEPVKEHKKSQISNDSIIQEPKLLPAHTETEEKSQKAIEDIIDTLSKRLEESGNL